MHPTWIFDLDNTLHNADHGIFPWINRSMTDYIMRQLGLDEAAAHALRHRYYTRYGATMRGMHRHHGIDPDLFLRETHPVAALLPLMKWDAHVGTLLAALPGRKILLSNGPQTYVEQVTRRMGIDRLFDALYGVERVGYLPKPHARPFITVCARERLNPATCIMVEDSLPNLLTAKSLGMRTVWITPTPRRPVYVDYRISSIRDLPRLTWLQA
ncbi:MULTISPECIES: pyrimidine 5'-nucleotidase [unclassified Paludibacterium]|uniref:pyrimidine 5'-nucleotidase n=1 Tax=unclassified Paludibacterium TaxID=2618429 RepID=UPI001C04EDD7|nr:pyrimidine 5'-nucleotidase [Paludibacterium sp. B53371]BEV72256.1 pyrimidine 5'-nucleotidase [Paludibacterium sp. THUN1379]